MGESTSSCPYTSTCLFYKNWTEQTGDKRLDVIIYGSQKSEPPYNCLTLMALGDFETGIPVSAQLRERLSNPENPNQRCSWIDSLNLLSAIWGK